MILVALGANLPGPAGSPLAACAAALMALEDQGVRIAKRSRWYRSAPVPPSDQPWYVNGMAAIATALGPSELLELLQRIEARFGRRRRVANEPRMLDLDLIDFNGLVRAGPAPPILPHPRLAERAFVLLPLADIAPAWRHPVTGAGLADLIAALPPGAAAEPLAESPLESPNKSLR
ncbi:MAG: 2-amino-4-hydroxy-6-hydroxymethyldihydropteridine diphosphokinase [Pseudomonadota bacterium]